MEQLPRLGARGEGWVALQGLLIVACIVAGRLGPRWPEDVASPLRGVGLALQIAGGLLVVAAFVRLGSSLTPFPRPRTDATLRTDGVYRLVRHPIYGGLILVFLGGSLTSAPLALVPTLMLAALFEGKRRVEERWLVEHDAAYADYRSRVRHAFIPGVW